MPLNSDIVISDTSRLIILTKINELYLLRKMGKEIFITPEIHKELGTNLPDWIKIRKPLDEHFQRLWREKLIVGRQALYC